MLRPEFAHLKYNDLPWNGAEQAPFTCVWVDKEQIESIFVR